LFTCGIEYAVRLQLCCVVVCSEGFRELFHVEHHESVRRFYRKKASDRRLLLLYVSRETL
jgi:hypothetical protein